jgi:hypothetical protein
MTDPIIKLEENGQAAIINYNVPEPTSYNGRFFLNIVLPQDSFKPDIGGEAVTVPFIPPPPVGPSVISDESSLRATVIKGLTSGFSDDLFAHLKQLNGVLRFNYEATSEAKPRLKIVSSEPTSPKLANLDIDEVVSMMRVGKRLNIYRSMYGTLTYDYFSAEANLIKSPIDDIPSGPIDVLDRIVYVFIREVNGKAADGANLSGTSPFRLDLNGDTRPIVHPGDRHYDQDTGRWVQDPPTYETATKVEVKFDTPGFSSGWRRASAENGDDFSSWSISQTVSTASGVGQRSYGISTRAFYGNSNTAKMGNSVTIIVNFTGNEPGPQDNTPPNVSITSPPDGLSTRGDYHGVTISVEGTASDPNGSGVKIVELTLDNDIGGYTAAIPTGPQANWSTWKGSLLVMTHGSHTITARCTDNAGNRQQASISVNVSITPTPPVTSLLLVERYRLSSYLGDYGAGRTVKTFSLLPGEKTKISVRSFTRTEETRAQSSSILDSFTQESSDDFESSLGRENTDKQNYDQNFKYYVDASAEASWGFGSCSVKVGESGGSNSAREEFAKNLSNVTQKHASKASAKRDVTVNTNYEQTTETETENLIERELQNINVGRTLNFVFRQMNQEFISILHLFDVRVALLRKEYIEGHLFPKVTYREVTLPQLNSFLDEVLVDDSKGRKQQVLDFIINQLSNVFDYNGDQQNTAEDVPFKDKAGNEIIGSNYLRFKKGLTQTWVDPNNPHRKITVPGIILSVDTNVMRTEGVIVESLLGQATALDPYSTGLQEEAVEAKHLSNLLTQTEIDKNNAGIKIVQDKDLDSAKIFEQVFPCCKPQVFSLWPPKDKQNTDEGTGSH